MMQTILISILLLSISVILLAIKILLKKNGHFTSGHACKFDKNLNSAEQILKE